MALPIAGAVPGAAVLDGEIVFLDRTGRPQFYNLMRRRSPQQFVAFDILWLDGRDLRGLPLIKRTRERRSPPKITRSSIQIAGVASGNVRRSFCKVRAQRA